jgi:uncharacterized delta-60 repeat protein
MISLPLVRLCFALALSLLVALLAAGAALAVSALDPGFGDRGVVQTPLPPAEQERVRDSYNLPSISDLSIGADGKIVAALGSDNEDPYIGAARFRLDGSLDASFGHKGFVPLEAAYRHISGEAELEAVALQRDGRTVLVGYRQTRDAHTALLLLRLRGDGTLDRGFGKGGLVTSRPRNRGAEVLHDVAALPDGRIVGVGGRNEYRTGKRAAIVVGYRPNGKVDRSFGHHGRLSFQSHRGDYSGLRSVVVLPGGKLLAAGYRDNRFFVVKLWPDGRLDRRFGGDGRVSIDLGIRGCCPLPAGLAITPKGGSVAFAAAPEEGTELVRLTPTGARVRGFGHRGVVFDHNSSRLRAAGGVAVQPDGRIVLAGTTIRPRPSDGQEQSVFTVLRYRPDGHADRSFGKAGRSSHPLGFETVGTSAVTLPGGRVLVGGATQLRSRRGYEDRLVLARTHS